ncbi:MAG TPA: TonB-dependent receptor [Thermoanaerobaculia bacterium]|nr:TonB-dependent receptor [Thermoanaerobaculia bacterium]
MKIFAATLLISLLAVSGFAQIQTGNIYGKVQAKDGSALPGVTVTLTGVGAPQTFVTDSNGNFRFLNLSPGTYALKAELAGYGTSTRTGLSVSIGRNLDVSMTLAPSVAETITVTAEAPLLDVRKSGTGATVTKIELEKVPTGRDPWVILQQTPGVLMDRINVGGNESGQQSVYVGKGTASSQQTFNVDGVNITDVGALGSSPTYYDFDAFEEMQVTTGGTDPRIQTPGVQLNMVTKRGTNDFRGSGRYYRTSGDWQTDPKIPAEAASYLAKSNEINQIDDYGLEAGGPIIRDRLWLWGAYSNQDIKLFVAQPAGQTRRFRDNTKLETYNGKVNAQILSNNSLAVAFTYGDKIKIGRGIGPSRPPETAYNQSGPTEIYKLEDTHIFNPNFYLTGLFSKVLGGFQLIGDQGKGCNDFNCALGADPAYFDVNDSSWHRSFLAYESDRPQTQYRADASTFFSTGSWNHELKFGFGHREAPVFSHLAWPGDYYMVFYDPAGTPGAFGGIALHRRMQFNYEVETQDFYVGDTMMLGNLTVQAGLRFDSQKGILKPGTTPANPLIPDILPALTYNGGDDIKWESISPRVGLTYTLGAQKKTLLRAAANRYVDQLGGSAVYLAHPLYYQYLYYYFTDINGDRKVTRNEIDLEYCAGLNAANACAYYGIDPNNTRNAVSPYRYDPNINPPRTDELILGFEHEIMTDLSIGVNATWRKRNDLITTRPEKTRGRGDFYTPADYRLGGTLTGTLPNGRSYSVPYYVLNSGVAAPIYYVITNRPDYDQEYRGLELTATKRMSNRWMMRGNFSWNDWQQNVGAGAIVDPTFQLSNGTGCDDCDGPVAERSLGSGDKGRIFINSKWSYNVTGVYQIPVVETSIGFNLMGRQGYIIPYTHRSPFTSEGFKSVIIDTDIDSHRLDNIHNLDLRLAKDFRFARTASLTISLDAFNVLNRNTVLQRNFQIGRVSRGASVPDPGANRIAEILSPRVFKLGARFTF